MKDAPIDKKDWKDYFETLTDRISGEQILIEIVSDTIGDQIEANWIPFFGVTYDHKDDIIDISAEHLNHMVRRPQAITVHHDNNHHAVIEIVNAEAEKHILKFKEPLFLPNTKH